MTGPPDLTVSRQPTPRPRTGPFTRLARPLARFVHVEAAGGLLLLMAAVVALVWANLPIRGSYARLWSTGIQIHVGSWRYEEDLLHFVNDGLMALFFLVVGLEIKRELVSGVLRDRRQVVLPMIAALGGMVVPALLFASINTTGDGSRGWGIPMATDIAFTLAVVTLLGARVPAPLRVFLLTLAIVDDLGAIAVIAVFYGDELRPAYLVAAAGITAAVWLMNRFGLTDPPILVATGIALWVALHESGVHATIAGVVMGMLTPARRTPQQLEPHSVTELLLQRRAPTASQVRSTATAIKGTVPTADRVVDVLHPWTGYVIVPLFALANAGVRLRGLPTGSTTVFLGVALGLFVGKCAGITAFAWLAIRARLTRLPHDVTWSQFVAAAMLAGIGFTVSLFVTSLAFTDAAIAESAKVGILLASTASAICGAWLFRIAAAVMPTTTG